MTEPLIASVQLQDLAEVIGPVAAVRLAGVYGGQESVYIPKHPRRTHWMVNVIGWDAFCALCAHYGRERIEIPRNAAVETLKRRILELEGQVSNREIARRLNCTTRYVRMVLNAGAATAQGDLFGDGE